MSYRVEINKSRTLRKVSRTPKKHARLRLTHSEKKLLRKLQRVSRDEVLVT